MIAEIVSSTLVTIIDDYQSMIIKRNVCSNKNTVAK